MGNSVKLDQECTAFEIPVVLTESAEDLLTTADLIREYFASIHAPAKELIMIDRCGHDPYQTMLDAQSTAVRKLTGRRSEHPAAQTLP